MKITQMFDIKIIIIIYRVFPEKDKFKSDKSDQTKQLLLSNSSL